MGSTGKNNFGDYAPAAGGTTKCENSVDAELEDVARQSYFRAHGVPPARTLVRLRPRTSAGRMVVEDMSGIAIGNLPTSFHYLAVCQGSGYSYEGEVTLSRASKIPVVEVHLDPV
jgi:hypothetical protein